MNKIKHFITKYKNILFIALLLFSQILLLTSCRYVTRKINNKEIKAIYNDYPYVCTFEGHCLSKEDIHIINNSTPEYVKTKRNIDIDADYYSDIQLYIHKKHFLKRTLY